MLQVGLGKRGNGTKVGVRHRQSDSESGKCLFFICVLWPGNLQNLLEIIIAHSDFLEEIEYFYCATELGFNNCCFSAFETATRPIQLKKPNTKCPNHNKREQSFAFG